MYNKNKRREGMSLITNILFNAYSLIILILISLQFSNNYSKESLRNKLFKSIVNFTMIMLIVDTLGRFDGHTGTIYVLLNHFGNFTIFLLNLVVPCLWLIYVCNEIYPKKNVRVLFKFLILINVLNILFLIISQFFGLLYYIDSENIYHRGPLFFVQTSIAIVIILLAAFLIIINRKKIENRYFFSLVFFAVPPFLCLIVQYYIYGISLVLNGIVLSLLFIFIRIQNTSIYTDYLTQINNRKRLDMFLEERIKGINKSNSFSAIMIDLNNFKIINDTYGHDIGDNVLKITAEILKSCINKEDFLARYGGDEFCIILNYSDKDKLNNTVKKITDSINDYNQSNKKPYKISLSMGYEIYNKNSGMTAEAFEKIIDKLMYKNKIETKK